MTARTAIRLIRHILQTFGLQKGSFFLKVSRINSRLTSALHLYSVNRLAKDLFVCIRDIDANETRRKARRNALISAPRIAANNFGRLIASIDKLRCTCTTRKFAYRVGKFACITRRTWKFTKWGSSSEPALSGESRIFLGEFLPPSKSRRQANRDVCFALPNTEYYCLRCFLNGVPRNPAVPEKRVVLQNEQCESTFLSKLRLN